MAELVITNVKAHPSDRPTSRSVDAPAGFQHLENFAKLVELDSPEFAPTGADVKADDTTLIANGQLPPDPVGTLSIPAPIARLSHTFTPQHYHGTVEFAPTVTRYASPFDVQPVVSANSGGAISVETSVTPAALTAWPGYVLILFASVNFIATHSACPSNGHLVPQTAEGRLWLPAPPSSRRLSTRLTGYSIPDTGEFRSFIPGLYYAASIYLTRTTMTALPDSPGATLNMLSYPSATLTWIQG